MIAGLGKNTAISHLANWVYQIPAAYDVILYINLFSKSSKN